jgi:beta-galactosidase
MSRIPALDIRPHRGAPCIHVDGAPHSGLAFWHAPGESGVTEWREFARCGVHLFQLDVGAWPQQAGGPAPTEAWDRTIATTVDADAQAAIWLRISTEPPAWWLEAHPEHAQLHRDQHNGDEFRWRAAYASAAWRAEAGEHLRRLVAHMETRWGERIWVYQLNAGDCGEWAYSWKPVVSGDAPAQVAAWRGWLQTRYGGDAGLRQAWNDPAAACATAQPPPWRTRMRAGGWPPPSHLIDPAAERPLVDWLHFHGTAQAEALASLAAATRSALRALGRAKLIGAFHGYHIWPYGSSYGPCNTGFSDLDPVLLSPDLDVLCTPLAYIHRNPGGVYSHHDLAATIRLHGKVFFAEDDTFTHRATWTPWRYCCRDAAETDRILLRNLAGALCEGGSQWWMDHNGEDWFIDAATETGLARMRGIADTALAHGRGSCAEVAFLSNEASFRILRQDDALIDVLWPRQQIEAMRLGAPVDFVRVRDLALAEASGDAQRWKLVIVAGCLWLDAAERELLERVLMRDGRHLVFLHGQGISDGARLDPALISALTGIAVKTYPHGGPCRGETMLDGVRTVWGTDKEVSPVLYADDPGAEVIGWLERQYLPALAQKRHDGWTATWSAVPGLPAALLGRLAEQAGVHRYLADGSQVMADDGLLAVHAAGDGPLTVRLPRQRRVTDALDGRDLGLTDRITMAVRRGDTRIWHLEG